MKSDQLIARRVYCRRFLAAAALLLCSSCTVKEAVEPLKPTGFLEHAELLEQPKYTPFDLAWKQPETSGRLYDTLLIEAVRTDQVDQTRWIYSAGTLLRSNDAYIAEVTELADYIQKSVAKRFERHSRAEATATVERGIPFQPVRNQLSPDAADVPAEIAAIPGAVDRKLSVQISIAAVDFGDPLVYGGLLAVPVPGVANLSTAARSPVLTLEARFRDLQTGEVVAELLDRRFPQLKIVDVNRLTLTSALHEIADSFADDLVASLYREPTQKIDKRWPFSLLPW
jgi:hypothetical protein